MPRLTNHADTATWKRRRLAQCLAAAAALTWLAASPVVAGALHPQDGPHADIRISMTDEALRFDVTMNLAFVDEIAPTEREFLEDLPDVEAPMVEAALAAYFRDRNRVTIDDVEVAPRLEGFAVLRPDEALLPLFPQSGRRGLLRVGFDLWYTFESPPQRVSMVWDTFPPDIVLHGDRPGDPPPMTIQVQLQAEGRLTVIDFTADEPEFTWHATGETIEDRFQLVPAAPARPPGRTVPALTLVLGGLAVLTLLSCVAPSARRRRLLVVAVVFAIGAGASWNALPLEVGGSLAATPDLPSDQDAQAIFAPLHANIYRAFDYTAESDIYDALSRSVDGRLLDRLYNEIYRSLIVYEEGGAISRVQRVTPIEARVLGIGMRRPDDGGEPVLGFEVRARWQVEGQVYHWGHSHTRINEYEADYTVVLTDAGWRIAGSRIREQFRIEIDDDDGPIELPPGFEL